MLCLFECKIFSIFFRYSTLIRFSANLWFAKIGPSYPALIFIFINYCDARYFIGWFLHINLQYMNVILDTTILLKFDDYA